MCTHTHIHNDTQGIMSNATFTFFGSNAKGSHMISTPIYAQDWTSPSPWWSKGKGGRWRLPFSTRGAWCLLMWSTPTHMGRREVERSPHAFPCNHAMHALARVAKFSHSQSLKHLASTITQCHSSKCKDSCKPCNMLNASLLTTHLEWAWCMGLANKMMKEWWVRPKPCLWSFMLCMLCLAIHR